MPSCWPADHWLHAAIRGSHLERLVKAKRHSLGLEFSLLQSYAAEHIPICWEDFLWCRCMVASRAYSLCLDGVTSQRCMVPWADLLNHGQGEELSARYAFQPGSSADDGYVLMRITKPVADGREVFQTYGVCSDVAANHCAHLQRGQHSGAERGLSEVLAARWRTTRSKSDHRGGGCVRLATSPSHVARCSGLQCRARRRI